MKPPTTRPEAGQGPWHDEVSGKWWVVADRPQDAIAAIDSVDPDAMPRYFGWMLLAAPCLIRWSPDYDGDELCIVEGDGSDDEETTAEGWRVWFMGR